MELQSRSIHEQLCCKSWDWGDAIAKHRFSFRNGRITLNCLGRINPERYDYCTRQSGHRWKNSGSSNSRSSTPNALNVTVICGSSHQRGGVEANTFIIIITTVIQCQLDRKPRKGQILRSSITKAQTKRSSQKYFGKTTPDHLGYHPSETPPWFHLGQTANLIRTFLLLVITSQEQNWHITAKRTTKQSPMEMVYSKISEGHYQEILVWFITHDWSQHFHLLVTFKYHFHGGPFGCSVAPHRKARI